MARGVYTGRRGRISAQLLNKICVPGHPGRIKSPCRSASRPCCATRRFFLAEPPPPLRTRTPGRREATTVHVVGFWKRLAAAAIDLAIVVPAALLITLIVSKIAGVHLPPKNMKLLDVDLWIDLVLATDPALVMGLVLFSRSA